MKAKSVIVILSTLIIGFILGMLTSAQIRYHRLNPVRMYFSEERFRDVFYKTIQPDARQKEKIDLILDKYAKMNGDIQEDFRKDLESNMKEFRKELDSNLTQEQLSRLKDLDEKRQEIVRHNRRNHENDSLNFREDRHYFPMRGHGRGYRDNDSTGLSDTK